MNKAYIILAIVAVAAVVSFIFYQQSQQPVQQTSILKIFCADSLLYPMQRAEEAFERENPYVDVQVEGHGSIQVIRHVTELHDVVDLLMVADYSLIPVIMYDTTMPNSTQPYSDWYVRFAGNDLVLAYTGQSNRASEVNSTNWYEILADPGTSFGLPNPEIDALGYRALIAIKLAEGYYGEPQLYYTLVSQNFNPMFISYSGGAGKTILLVPETQTPVGGKVYLRASGVMLIPLLESGTIDYCFLYKSMAEQQNFSCVELPPEISMGDASQEPYYSQVTVEFQHQRFATVNLNRTGSTIYYGMTIPANAPNPALAASFIQFMVNGTGRAIFEASHFPVFGTCYTDNLQAVPSALTAFIWAEP